MKVVIKNVNERPKVAEIGNDLESMHEIVGGYIESVYIGNNIFMICNEEGKLFDLKPNFVLDGDVVVGNVFFAQADGAEFTDLSDENITIIMNKFKTKN